jgi:Holliday junction resolvase-like predicted endonuclease
MREASSAKIDRCKSHYEAIYNDSTSLQPLECVLHAFLNGAPSTSAITSQERAIGLASASFWLKQKILPNNSLIKFSIGKLLIFDGAIPLSFIKVIIKLDAELLRWGIRYSQLFKNRNSVICEHLRTNYQSDDWIEFFAVCDRLLIQLQPYKDAIKALEKKLQFLSITDFFSYLSLLAWQQYFDHLFDDTKFDFGRVYDRLLRMKLLSVKSANLQVSDVSIAQSLKSHLMPLLLPESHPQKAVSQCIKNLELVTDLFKQTKELIDYEGSIDWFCYSENCRYQFLPNKPVLFDEDDLESKRWTRTGYKSDLLWHYWFNRGVQQFLNSEFATTKLGSEENQDANVTAIAKAFRSCVHLEAIYGIDNTIQLTPTTDISLFELMLTTELHSALYTQEYVGPVHENLSQGVALTDALSALMLQGFSQSENRLPFTWSKLKTKSLRIKNWFISDKSSKSPEEKALVALAFWSLDLNALAGELKSQDLKPIPRLHEKPFLQLGEFIFQLPWLMADSNHMTATVNNLRRLKCRRAELNTETQNAEEKLAESLRASGFNVLVGYQPDKSPEDDVGEIDLLCHKDGIVLMLELKTGYVRSSKKEIWLHKNNTLRKASWQLKRKSTEFPSMLLNDLTLSKRLGIEQDNYSLHCWIVDTCIEFDGVYVDEYLVVSREALEVVMRDEAHMLCNIEHLQEEREPLFPDGYSAKEFIDVIESQAIWRNLETKSELAAKREPLV